MDYLIAALVVFIGSFVQSSIGFGLALIAAPILFLLDPAFVPAPVTLSALALSLANAWSFRHSISFRGLKYAFLGRVPGTIAGGLLLLWISQESLALWLGASVLIAVALSAKNMTLQPTPTYLAGAGFLSGFMGTSSSIGGPPMALVLQYQEADYIRANMSAFFVVSSIMSLIVLFFVGRLGALELSLSMPLLPASILGYWLAMQTLHLFSHRVLRICTLVLCAVAGLMSILSFWV